MLYTNSAINQCCDEINQAGDSHGQWTMQFRRIVIICHTMFCRFEKMDVTRMNTDDVSDHSTNHIDYLV